MVSPNRFIGENTRLIYDVMQYLKNKNKPGLLLLVDFEKAFDSVEWSFINKTLEIYGFGNHFIKMFNLLYKDSESCVINNACF